jgi:hypothetical protein
LPRISVILPTYNRAPYLPEAIESVLGQSWRDFELIVVDDGSTDETREVVRAYSGKIRYLRRANGGPAAARNAGLRVARGELIAFLDSDDVFFPWRLGCHVKAFDEFPGAGLAWSRSTFFRGRWRPGRGGGRDGERVRTKLEDIFEDLLLWRKEGMLINGVTLRASCLERSGYFDESLPLAEDYDLWLRVAAHQPVVFADRVVAACRVHAGQRDGAGFVRGDRQTAFERILEKVVEDLPPSRCPVRVRQLVEQRRGLIALERALVGMLLREDSGEAARLIGEALGREARLGQFQDQIAETASACAAALDGGDPACPRSVSVLEGLRRELPRRLRRLRRRLGKHLAHRYSQRGFALAGQGKRMESVLSGVQALRRSPGGRMLRTLGSICRGAIALQQE